MTPNARLSLMLDRAVNLAKKGRDMADLTDIEVMELSSVFNREHLRRTMQPRATAFKAGDEVPADFGEPFEGEE